MSTIPYHTRTTLQSAVVATGNGTAMNVAGLSSLAIQISGTFVGTVTFEATVNLSTWDPIRLTKTSDGTVDSTATTTGIYTCPVMGCVQFRARVSAYTSGTITAVGYATVAGAGFLNAVTVAGEAHVGEVGGNKIRVSVEKTRPADVNAYTAKDAISESTSAGTVWTFASIARKTGGSGYIVRAAIQTDQTTNTESFRLHLFNATPTALNDNVVCTAPLYADASKYVGTIDFSACKVEGSGATAAYANTTPNTAGSNLPMAFVCGADANLYGLLETPNGFTPASGQKIIIVLVAEND